MKGHEEPTSMLNSTLVPSTSSCHYAEESPDAQYNYLLPLLLTGDDVSHNIYMKLISWPSDIDTAAILETKAENHINKEKPKGQKHQSLQRSSVLPEELGKQTEHTKAVTIQKLPSFKEVRYYSEGSRRTCFINFDEPSSTKHAAAKQRSQKEPHLPELATTTERIIAKPGARRTASEPGLSTKSTYTKLRARASIIVPEPSANLTTNRLRTRSATNRDQKLHDIQLNSHEDETTQCGSNDGERGSEDKVESPKRDDVTLTIGRRIRYTSEQESWILDYVTENFVGNWRKDWMACRKAFLVKYKQDRKAFSLFQKWKELKGYLVTTELYREFFRDAEKGVGGKKRKRGVVEVEWSGDDDSDGDEHDMEGSEGIESGDVEGDNYEEGELKGNTTGLKVQEPNNEDRAKHRNKHDRPPPNKAHKVTQELPSERIYKHYTKEEMDWLLSHVEKMDGKMDVKIDWGAVAYEFTKRFKYTRKERMLCYKWKEAKKIAERDHQAKKARLS